MSHGSRNVSRRRGLTRVCVEGAGEVWGLHDDEGLDVSAELHDQSLLVACHSRCRLVQVGDDLVPSACSGAIATAVKLWRTLGACLTQRKCVRTWRWGQQMTPPVLRRHQAAPAGCLVVALSRLNRLVVATHRTSPASCFSSKCFAASSHTSSGTGSARSARRVIDSAKAKAALSASVKRSVSRQAATAKSRSSLSPAFLALTIRCRHRGCSR